MHICHRYVLSHSLFLLSSTMQQGLKVECSAPNWLSLANNLNDSSRSKIKPRDLKVVLEAKETPSRLNMFSNVFRAQHNYSCFVGVYSKKIWDIPHF